jgi:hypothetical protein
MGHVTLITHVHDLHASLLAWLLVCIGLDMLLSTLGYIGVIIMLKW